MKYYKLIFYMRIKYGINNQCFQKSLLSMLINALFIIYIEYGQTNLFSYNNDAHGIIYTYSIDKATFLLLPLNIEQLVALLSTTFVQSLFSPFLEHQRCVEFLTKQVTLLFQFFA